MIGKINAYYLWVGEKKMSKEYCKTCIHSEVCFHQEVQNNADEWAKEFGCPDYLNLSSREIHSQWSLHPDGSGTCNHCGKTQKAVWDFDNKQNFCGYCGANMQEIYDDCSQ